jgi:hypothetical protein
MHFVSIMLRYILRYQITLYHSVEKLSLLKIITTST